MRFLRQLIHGVPLYFLLGKGDFADAQALIAECRRQRLLPMDIVAEDGARAYIEQINIRGNSRTRDHVIRREVSPFQQLCHSSLGWGNYRKTICPASLVKVLVNFFQIAFKDYARQFFDRMDKPQVDLIEGAPGFAQVTGAINGTVTHIEGFYTSYGLSDASLKHYRSGELAVEVLYPTPVTIHAPYRFGNPDSLFFGLSGSLGEDRTIFGGHNGVYWAGAMRLSSYDTLRKAAEAIPCARHCAQAVPLTVCVNLVESAQVAGPHILQGGSYGTTNIYR